MSRRALTAYVVLAFALSWAWWIPMVLGGDQSRGGVGWPTHLPGLLGPALAALVVTAATEGRPGLRRLLRSSTHARPSAWLWVGAILALGAAALGVQALLGTPPTWTALREFSGAPLLTPAVLLHVLVVNGFGEELGWRGFLVHHLEPGLGLVRAALVTGVVWALWHAPLFWVVANFTDMTATTTAGWLLGLLCGSVVLAWLYLAGGRSTLLVAVWHTAFNLTSATTGTQGVIAAATSTAVMVAAVVIILRARPRRPRRGQRVRPASSGASR